MRPGNRIATARWLLVALLATWSAATAAASLAPWPDRSTQAPVVRGHFTQKKHLAELEQPLVSRGRFVAARGRGLIWQVEQPIKSRLVITRDQLVQSSNGHQTLRLDADQQPGLRVVAAVLLAVFQADTQRLEQYFEVAKEHDDAGWRLTLTPKTAALKQFIQRVTLSGAHQLTHIDIAEPGGDRDDIALQIDAHGPARLSASEQAAFSH